jgi:dTDP-4-dehydrorhamnose 3,5-epimerase-like enzyme
MKTKYGLPTVQDIKIISFPLNITTLGNGQNAGHLVAINMPELPFIPKRMFHVSNVQHRFDRGRHAHYDTTQLITCVSGSVKLTLKDGIGGVVSFNLSQPQTAILVPRMIWDEVNYADSQSTLLVFSDTEYDPEDYIISWDKYINEYNKTS